MLGGKEPCTLLPLGQIFLLCSDAPQTYLHGGMDVLETLCFLTNRANVTWHELLGAPHLVSSINCLYHVCSFVNTASMSCTLFLVRQRTIGRDDCLHTPHSIGGARGCFRHAFGLAHCVH